MKVAMIACLLLIAPTAMGCAHETVVTTTTSSCVESPEDHSSRFDYEPDDPSCGRVVKEVVVETQSDRCHGVISCTFTVVGEVIALPFRIVGAAFDVIL